MKQHLLTINKDAIKFYIEVQKWAADNAIKWLKTFAVKDNIMS